MIAASVQGSFRDSSVFEKNQEQPVNETAHQKKGLQSTHFRVCFASSVAFEYTDCLKSQEPRVKP